MQPTHVHPLRQGRAEGGWGRKGRRCAVLAITLAHAAGRLANPRLPSAMCVSPRTTMVVNARALLALYCAAGAGRGRVSGSDRGRGRGGGRGA